MNRGHGTRFPDLSSKIFLTPMTLRPTSTDATDETSLPHCLREARAVLFKAKIAVQGIGIGRIVRVADTAAAVERAQAIVDPARERERLLNAMQALDSSYAERIRRAAGKLEAGLLQAHRAMARDPAMREWLLAAVRDGNRTASEATAAASDHFAGVFSASASVLLRERALDVRDVCRQLARQLNGSSSVPPAELTQDSILIAEGLTPSDLLALDRQFLKGLALSRIGPTSHTVILAQSFGIPCVIDVAHFPGAGWNEKEAIVDGELGLLAVELTPAARRYYDMERRRLKARKARAQRVAAVPGQTSDGSAIGNCREYFRA